jgi:hypothetical protein
MTLSGLEVQSILLRIAPTHTQLVRVRKAIESFIMLTRFNMRNIPVLLGRNLYSPFPVKSL